MEPLPRDPCHTSGVGGQYGGMDTSTPPEDALGSLLVAGAPPVPELDPDRTAGLARALVAEVVEADRTLLGRVRGLRRRHRAAAVATAAAIVLVPSGAWAAQHFLARTGTYGNPALNPGLEDGSERIDTCARDFAAYVATLAPTDLPAPPGHRWSDYAAQQARSYTSDGTCTPGAQGTVQETSLRVGMLSSASGDWGCALVRATRDRDPAATAEARRAMEGLDAEAHRISPQEGSVGTWEPDRFLAVSRDPKFVGCQR